MESFGFAIETRDHRALQSIVSRVAGLGYHEKGICERLELPDISELQWRALPIYRQEKLHRRELLDLAIDLLLLQGTLAAAELSRLFCRDEYAFLVRLGVLQIADAGLVRTSVSLFPVGERLIFSDPAWPLLSGPERTGTPPDQVMYIGKDSHWLARATVRDPVGSALDLCTGSGVHAVLAAKHATRVVAVDVSPRAARCARFNAAAYGDTNVDIRVGDLYEPAGIETFDLITANPPFVPAPAQAVLYRDGGQSGEDVQRRIIAGLPQHLARSGIAQMVTEFGVRGDEPLADRLRVWLAGAPMDMLVLVLREHSMADYAMGHADGNDTYGAFLVSVQQWHENLKANGYTKMISVLLAFQWSDGAPWTRYDHVQPPSRAAGNEIRSIFLSEQMVCKDSFMQGLEACEVRHAGPVGMVETHLLGAAADRKVQAKVLGQALASVQWLAPVELEVLGLIAGLQAVPDVIAMAGLRQIDKPAALAALRSLLRRGLIVQLKRRQAPADIT